jgi:hypothetical protein
MSRANRILTIALAVIVVLAVVAALVSRTRSASELQPGSPEATVQAYVDAALAGMGMQTTRVVLVDSSVEGSTATVRVDLVYASGNPFDPSEFSDRQTYHLARSGSGWVLTGVPWPLFECWKE